MGLIIIIAPVVIYYYLIKWLFNKYYKDTNKTKRRIFFILLVTLPFWDHIAGYTYYKYLCFTKGGITIYKTVTDLQEQKDYWFQDYIIGGILDENAQSYTNLDRELEKIKKPFSRKIVLKRPTNNIKGATAYLNYCNTKYNNLPTTNKNYKKSCKYTDTIIKKYNLENVIKVPRSPYRMYVSTFDKSYKHKISNLFPISLSIHKVHNNRTGEILVIDKHYSYGVGWYLNIFSSYYKLRGSGCPKEIGMIELQEMVIANPYKKSTKGK